MRWLAIINPEADHHEPDALRLLNRRLCREVGADCLWMDRLEDAGRLVCENPHYGGYIAVGGDTTISEVVNGFPAHGGCLGIIPAGTGNGLARDLHLASEAAAMRTLVRPHFTNLDWIEVCFRQNGTWRRRRMISTSGIGYIAGATEIADCHRRRWGLLSHSLGAVLQTFRQRPFPVRVSFDGELSKPLLITSLVIQNTQFVGAFHLAPEARVDDGLFDVLFGCLSPMRQLVEDLDILLRSHLLHGAEHRQGRTLTVELPESATLMLDGNLHAHVSEVRFQVAPAQLRCCVAAGAFEESSFRTGRRATSRTSFRGRRRGSPIAG